MAAADDLDLDPDSSEYALVYACEHGLTAIMEAMGDLSPLLSDRLTDDDYETVYSVLQQLEDRYSRTWAAFDEYLARSGKLAEDAEVEDAEWAVPFSDQDRIRQIIREAGGIPPEGAEDG